MALATFVDPDSFAAGSHQESDMPDDRQPAQDNNDTMPREATPHNPGLAPKPSTSSTDGKPAAGAPSDKKDDPEQQPT